MTRPLRQWLRANPDCTLADHPAHRELAAEDFEAAIGARMAHALRCAMVVQTQHVEVSK